MSVRNTPHQAKHPTPHYYDYCLFGLSGLIPIWAGGGKSWGAIKSSTSRGKGGWTFQKICLAEEPSPRNNGKNAKPSDKLGVASRGYKNLKNAPLPWTHKSEGKYRKKPMGPTLPAQRRKGLRQKRHLCVWELGHCKSFKVKRSLLPPTKNQE